jgi:hypothetical protein
MAMPQANRDKHNIDILIETVWKLRDALRPNTPIIKIDEAYFAAALGVAIAQQDVSTLEKLAYDCRNNPVRLNKLRQLVARLEIDTTGFAI